MKENGGMIMKLSVIAKKRENVKRREMREGMSVTVIMDEMKRRKREGEDGITMRSMIIEDAEMKWREIVREREGVVMNLMGEDGILIMRWMEIARGREESNDRVSTLSGSRHNDNYNCKIFYDIDCTELKIITTKLSNLRVSINFYCKNPPL